MIDFGFLGLHNERLQKSFCITVLKLNPAINRIMTMAASILISMGRGRKK